jgi:hypothetical protein
MRRRRQSTPPCEADQKSNSADSSALATLDSALINETTRRGREGYVPYYGEGDITALVMNNSETSPRTQRPQKKKSTKSTLLSTSFDAELGLGGYDEEPFGSSPFLKATADQDERPRTRGLSSGGNRQRTPSPGSARSRNGLPPSSPPIQRNASRPSSSQGGGIVGGIAARTPSAPFKVLVPLSSRNDEEDFVSRVASNPRVGGPQENARQDDKLRQPRIHNDIWDVSDDSSDDEICSAGKRSNTSIVHRDSVRRGGTSSSHLSRDVDEELAVDHLSRRKMCDENVFVHKTAASSNAMKIFTSQSPAKQELCAPDRNKRTNTLANVVSPSLSFCLQPLTLA